MKIIIGELKNILLHKGEYEVKISKVVEGQINGMNYFKCTFENRLGYFDDTFILSLSGLNKIFNFLNALDFYIYEEDISLSDFVGKRLKIRIETEDVLGLYNRPNNSERFISEYGKIKKETNEKDFESDFYCGEKIYRSDDLDFYNGDIDDFSYGGFTGEEAMMAWNNTN